MSAIAIGIGLTFFTLDGLGFRVDDEALAAGIVLPVIHSNAAGAEHYPERPQAHQLIGQGMLAIASNTGNRWRHRTGFQVAETSTNYLQANSGGAPVKRCGTCMARCAWYKNHPYFQGAEKAKMADLAEWAVDSDRVLTF